MRNRFLYVNDLREWQSRQHKVKDRAGGLILDRFLLSCRHPPVLYIKEEKVGQAVNVYR